MPTRPTILRSILKHLADQEIEAVIALRSHRIVQRTIDQHRYKDHNLIKQFFCPTKQFWRIATRYLL